MLSIKEKKTVWSQGATKQICHVVTYLAMSALLPHSEVLPGLPESLGPLSQVIGLGQSETVAEDWKVGRERSGLFISTPLQIWPMLSGNVCFLHNATALLAQPPFQLPSSPSHSKGLCLPCSSCLGAGDVSLWLISVSSLSISGFINPSHIFANVLLGPLSHLSTSLCLLRLWLL